MYDQIPLQQSDLSTNYEDRCPIILLLDTSLSMHGERINDLNKGLKSFEQDLRDDSLARKRCEIAMISFGERVQVVTDFVAAEHFQPSQFIAGGNTPMGEAVNLALDMLEARKAQYKQAGIKYYRPLVFLVTDGAPTDAWHAAAQRVEDGEAAGRFAFFAFGVSGAEFSILKAFSKKRPPIELRGTKFREMFLWMSGTMKALSHSVQGSALQLQKPSDEWTI